MGPPQVAEMTFAPPGPTHNISRVDGNSTFYAQAITNQANKTFAPSSASFLKNGNISNFNDITANKTFNPSADHTYAYGDYLNPNETFLGQTLAGQPWAPEQVGEYQLSLIHI